MPTLGAMWHRVLFIATGATFAANFIVTERLDPNYQDAKTAADWFLVLSFSAIGLLVAGSVVAMARLLGDEWMLRAAVPAALGGAVIAVSNLVEDGLHVQSFFYLTAVGLVLLDGGLLALAVLIAWRGSELGRWLALAPLITLVVIVALHGFAGALLVLGAWFGVAILIARAAVKPARATAP